MYILYWKSEIKHSSEFQRPIYLIFSSIIFFQLGCTTWTSKDLPGGMGDYENMWMAMNNLPTRVNEVRNLLSSCQTTNYVIQARLNPRYYSSSKIYENTAQALADTGSTLVFNYKPLSDPDSEFGMAGISCRNSGFCSASTTYNCDCYDFEVRYCCSKCIPIHYLMKIAY